MTHVVEARFAVNARLVGGKAASLGRLASAGFAPPEFFVIVPDAFAHGILRQEAAEEILHAVAKLGTGPFAVRSSGRCENDADAAQAGQYLSLLNVEAEAVLDAAMQVWQSGTSKTASEYRRLRGLAGNGAGPAIIVQQMVEARAAGVAFSADPVTGLQTWVLISAVEGLGDALLSGTAKGEDYRIDKASGIVVDQPSVPSALTPHDIAAITDLAIRVEAAFGAAQDIEWAFAGDRLYILQARPITATLLRQPRPDPAVGIFDRSNIVGYPGIVSPLTYSFAVSACSRICTTGARAAGVPASAIRKNRHAIDNLLARIDGRLYLNLVNASRLLAALPGFSRLPVQLETVMGVSEPLPAEIVKALRPPPAKGLRKALEVGRFIRSGTILCWHALNLRRTVRSFNERLDADLDADMGGKPLDLKTAPLSALAAEYRRIETEYLDRWHVPLLNAFFCRVALAASRKLLRNWLGPSGRDLHDDIMIGQGDLISGEPVRRTVELGKRVARIPGLAGELAEIGIGALDPYPDLVTDVAAFVARFGDRCVEELKFESIPLDEDPGPLMLAMAGAAARTGSPNAAATSKGAPLAGRFPNRPFRSLAARLVVGWARARVRDRENLRFARARIFGHIRKLFLGIGRELQAGGYLDHERDVLHLSVGEILGAIEGSGMTRDLRAIAAMRLAERDATSQHPDPPIRILVHGAAINALTAERRDRNAEAVREDVKQGTGCSHGTVGAVARVIRHPDRQTLAPGEILIARDPDPGWIALFCCASAIVVERSSRLSVSAIVARELDIPCIVGLKDATRWIADGDRIAVDGATGSVTRVRT